MSYAVVALLLGVPLAYIIMKCWQVRAAVTGLDKPVTVAADYGDL